MKNLKILFADDDLKYVMILKRFLEAEGYEVFYAGNGRIALEQYPEVNPDLVLLDINMPEMNGYEVARQIREHDRHVLIFFLTDRSDKTDRLEGFKVRANDYLAKPFYPEELIARIKERFDMIGEQVETETYQFGHTTFDYTNNELRTRANKVMITSRQAEILKMLARNLNVVVSREQLLEQIWGDSSYANSLALNVQITYLRKALKEDASVKIESLMKKGYVLKG
ncbi:response regulator transcription factor [uncultured Bacteroides sp.]|uniref:response regulator transcription factor n=1 Tax=uncultured Bacteroides sp. TaxID=162156 RepID=UPI002637089E|nr:response regulator transcription factor [uncultured Bacteroides sp.]